MIAIIDYGMGNLRSVQKAFERVGHSATITSDPDAVGRADRVVLPGVGAFRDAIAELNRSGLGDAFRAFVATGKPALGVCLGLQLLFDVSEEDGEYEGLGLIPGRVVRFDASSGVKVPHMGWNSLRIVQEGTILGPEDEMPSVYFVHSYYARPKDVRDIAAFADYPSPFCAAVCRGNLTGCQFHPEKSQKVGLEMYRRFAEEH
jgi:imidazole glycerol-phosphate synthase subunit HisH